MKFEWKMKFEELFLEIPILLAMMTTKIENDTVYTQFGKFENKILAEKTKAIFDEIDEGMKKSKEVKYEI